MESPGGGERELRVQASRGRPACVVAVDLRHRDRLGAVAVDARGEVRAWASSLEARNDVEAEADAIAELVRRLGVRPRELRILLAERDVHVATLGGPFDDRRAEQEMLGEGFEPLQDPAYAVREEAAFALVARAGESRLAALAEAVSRRLGLEPSFTAPALVMLPDSDGGIGAEYDGERLVIVARRAAAEPLVRSLGAASIDRAADEIYRTQSSYDLEGPLFVLGRCAGELRRELRTTSPNLRVATSPAGNLETAKLELAELELAVLELALRLAREPEPPMMHSPLLSARRVGARWASRLSAAAVVIGLLGALLTLVTLADWWRIRARNEALGAEREEVDSQLTYLRESAALAGEVRQLRSTLARYRLSEPKVAASLAALERASPPGIGWRQVRIEEGVLEMQVSAAGALADRHLESFRSGLDDLVGLSNPAWDPPRDGEPDLRLQTVRATLVPGEAGGGS